MEMVGIGVGCHTESGRDWESSLNQSAKSKGFPTHETQIMTVREWDDEGRHHTAA